MIYQRGSLEFDRAATFFDATFAVALTLLATTLDTVRNPADWVTFHSLVSAIGTEFLAFVLSFTVVGYYWLANHRFIARLDTLTTPILVGNLVLLFFVVLLPFSTEALGESSTAPSTAVYAVNVALVSAMEAVNFWLAWAEQIMPPRLSSRAMLISLVPQLVPSVVFLASVPITVWLSAAAGRLSWLSLALLSPLAGRWARRRIARG